MRRQPPIVRCFGALCCLCAVTLVTLEWRNPFPDPVVTPDNAINVEDGRQGASAQAADWPTETDGSTQKFWQRNGEEQSITAAESSVRLTLSLEDRHLEVVRDGKPTIRFEVAVGQDDWQTPTGEFAVMSKLENPAWMHPITKEEIPPGPENPLGNRWIGFWSDGVAQIGFHGTNQEELIGEAVSHGCVRMRNRDIKMLYELVEVGTIVQVFAESSEAEQPQSDDLEEI
ncbi:MAG: L,D-transpeptidase [Cyanobacteria bacterium J06621_11]